VTAHVNRSQSITQDGGQLGGDSRLPRYVQIRDWLLARILTYYYEDKIESEAAIAEVWSVSRGTVQQAVDLLVRMGVLERRQGSGTFINAQRRDRLYPEIPSFTHDLRRAGQEPTPRILSVEEAQASDEVAAALELPSGSPVVLLERLIETRRRPFAVMKTALPRSRFEPEMFERAQGSLYALLRDVHRCTPCKVSDTIQAVNADPAIAAVLGVEPGVAIFRSERIGWDQNGEAFEFTRAYAHTADLPLCIEIERGVAGPGNGDGDGDGPSWRYRVHFGKSGDR
jgi:DNA-binding GntR family transcriptional regulator